MPMATQAEQVWEFICRTPGRDDDEIARLLKITPRQTVNMICRRLEREGRIRRTQSPHGKLVNVPTIPEKPAAPAATAVATEPWYWEGNVVEALAAHFGNEGWEIVSRADTASRADDCICGVQERR